MSNYDVLMDTGIFTDIVDDIRTSSSECVLSEEPLSSAKVWEHTDVGIKMTGILEKVYKASEAYRIESSKSLPDAFFKLRDSMIQVDETAAESLDIDK